MRAENLGPAPLRPRSHAGRRKGGMRALALRKFYELQNEETRPGYDLAPQVGFEPTTLRLTAECSTVELLRSNTGGFLKYYTTGRAGFNLRPAAGSARARERNFARPARCPGPSLY